MNQKKSNGIYWRSVITFYIIISFIVMSISGIILYFAPPGRVAFWSEWTFIALAKQQWQAVHTIFTFIFVFAASFHIYFNWSVITSYLKKKMSEGMKRRNELILASLFSIIISALTIGSVPPLSLVMDFGENLSESWSDDSSEPPVPHAELLSLPEFAVVIKTDVEQLIHSFKTNGLNVPSKQMTVKELAEINGLTPQKVYEKANIDKSNIPISSIGSGYGRKSILEICEEFNIDPELALSNLKKNGIDTTPVNKIKEVALEHDLLPIDIVEIIQSKEQIEINNL